MTTTRATPTPVRRGEVFGDYRVVGPSPLKGRVRCRCKCGAVRHVLVGNLRAKCSQRCEECRLKRRAEQAHTNAVKKAKALGADPATLRKVDGKWVAMVPCGECGEARPLALDRTPREKCVECGHVAAGRKNQKYDPPLRELAAALGITQQGVSHLVQKYGHDAVVARARKENE